MAPALDDIAAFESDDDDNFGEAWEEAGTEDSNNMSEHSSPMSGVGIADPAASTVMASQVMMLEAIQDGFADYTSEYGFFGKMQAGWAGAVARRLHSFKSGI